MSENNKDTNSVSDSPRPGRPRKLSYRDINYIYNQVRVNHRLNNASLAKLFNNKVLSVSSCTKIIRKELKKQKVGSYTALRKPLL